MALSTHWEWRGFGKVSERFRRQFDTLEPAFGGGQSEQSIVDAYLWIPGIDINLKFRAGTGTQDGLKFKRLSESRGAFEKWIEAPDEIFPFPLNAKAWQLLQQEMGKPFDPPVDAGHDEAVRFLQSVEPRTRTVIVRKQRRAAVWGDARVVKVELAEILTPVATTSVGLEAADSSLAVALLKQAATDLGLDSEALEPMNYLDFIRRCVN